MLSRIENSKLWTTTGNSFWPLETAGQRIRLEALDEMLHIILINKDETVKWPLEERIIFSVIHPSGECSFSTTITIEVTSDAHLVANHFFHSAWRLNVSAMTISDCQGQIQDRAFGPNAPLLFSSYTVRCYRLYNNQYSLIEQ